MKTVGAILLALCLALAARTVWVWRMEARLLDTWPEAAGANPNLVRFASSIARPALAAHCAGCHGADLRGDRRRGAPNLVDGTWLYGDGEVVEIEQTVLHGIRSGDHRSRDFADMPAFARATPYRRYRLDSLSPAEIADLADYVIRISGGRASDPAAAVRGAALFRQKAQCYDCHAADAGGDNLIGAPSLTAHPWIYGDGSRPWLEDIIAYGRRGVCPAWSGRLKPAVIRAIAVYLHDRSRRA